MQWRADLRQQHYVTGAFVNAIREVYMQIEEGRGTSTVRGDHPGSHGQQAAGQALVCQQLRGLPVLHSLRRKNTAC